MISPLATLIEDKGERPRPRVTAVLLHTTGSGIVEQAKQVGKDPEAFAVKHYKQANEFPHYLVGHSGTIYAFCDELKWAWHAAWKSWELIAYRDGSWVKKFARDYLDDVVPVKPGFYADWTNRWDANARGTKYKSPFDLLKQIGSQVSPNEVTIGVEILNATPFNPAQIDAVARLFCDVAARHNLLDPSKIVPGSLPQAWLCGHSDVSPCRRFAHRGKGGYSWDPAPANLDWSTLEAAILKISNP